MLAKRGYASPAAGGGGSEYMVLTGGKAGRTIGADGYALRFACRHASRPRIGWSREPISAGTSIVLLKLTVHVRMTHRPVSEVTYTCRGTLVSRVVPGPARSTR